MHGDGMYADGTDAARRGRGGSPGRGRRAGAILALILGLVGFAVSMTAVVIQLLPRQFTAGQQRTLPIWMLAELIRPHERPVTNVVAVAVIVVTALPILAAYYLTREGEHVGGAGK